MITLRKYLNELLPKGKKINWSCALGRKCEFYKLHSFTNVHKIRGRKTNVRVPVFLMSDECKLLLETVVFNRY